MVFEEDIEKAVDIAVKVLGPQGRLVYGGAVDYNCIVSTKEHGTLWYGDLEQKTAQEKIQRLSKNLNDVVVSVKLDQ